ALASKIDFGNGDSPLSDSSYTTVSPKCYKNSTTLARLEPNGKILFGFHLDWKIQVPSNVTKILSPYSPGIYNAFVQLDATKGNGSEYDVNLVNWHAQQIQLAGGGFFELTIEPISDLAGLTDELFTRIATQCRVINEKYGIPILLRFGHEMNGIKSSKLI
ncbi:hypothetical protein HK096_008987, partial [Nowakowskiella sp. JEL0078]